MCRRCMSLMILMVKKLLKDFAKKKCQEKINQSLELKKVIKKKGDKQNVKLKNWR